MAYKGVFKPKNPQKYNGDPTNIIYRSSWELKYMMYLDSHENVLNWSSEEVIVPYRSPIDNKVHRYFPDFVVKIRNTAGMIETIMVEIKPYDQTKPPKAQTKKTKRYINEVYTWGINSAKWESAKKYCENKGWKFVVLTENELGIKF
jgi:hypothetical protein